MASFTPRRGPNMNQYIANLNIAPAVGESAAPAEYPKFEDELSLFTNVEFLNEFDLGENVEGPSDGPAEGRFDDGFTQFAYLPAEVTPGIGRFPAPAATDFAVRYPLPASTTSAGFPATPTTPGPGDGPRPATATTASSPDAYGALDGSSRAVAEEDKRRRNTAASARFRVKKKQREQALERTAKEMTDRADKLEARIAELEQENKFLRSLVVEKAGGEADGTLRKVAADARKADSKKKGVGTTSA